MIKLRPSTLRQLREECDYAFIYHRDSAGRPAVTHCILYNRADSIYCRGFAILSPLDIKLGQVRKKRGEMVALGRAWKALQTGVSFGPVGRWHVEDLLTDLADPLEGDPHNPILATLAITTEDFHKAQYNVTPLYEEHEALEARRPKKVETVDWSIEYPISAINCTLRAIAQSVLDDTAQDPNVTQSGDAPVDSNIVETRYFRGVDGGTYVTCGPPMPLNP